MEKNIVKALIGYFPGVALTALTFYGEWRWSITLWVVLVVLVCGLRLYLAWRTIRRAPMPCRPADIYRHLALTILMSAAMSGVPTWIVIHSDGFAAIYMMLAIVSILWAGALVQITVFPLVAGYVSTMLVIWLACAVQAGWTADRAILTALFCLASGIAFEVTRQLSHWLEQGLRHHFEVQRQSDELQHQTEVIGLLLREHEEESSDWLWQTDLALRIQHPSARFGRVFDELTTDVAGMRLDRLLAVPGHSDNAAARDTLRMEIAAERSFRDLIVPGALRGAPRWWSLSGRPIHDSGQRVVGYRGVMADVTAACLAQAQVLHLAHHDALTGLPNRARFFQCLEDGLRARGSERLAVIAIDLDGFKPVNDRYGHAVGDALLVGVAERLRGVVAETGLVARLGGDEFAIKVRTTGCTETESLAKTESLAEMENLCRRLLDALGAAFTIEGQDIVVGASIGVAFAARNGETAGLIRNADAALYRAKRDGRGTFRFFATEMDRVVQERILLLQDLREAIAHAELVLHYQPFIDARTGRVTGCEALIRWQHPTRGLVSPADFIPLAEESNLISRIGTWVIGTACAEAATWTGGQRVSVNISPVQFQNHDLPDQILAALSAAGLPAHRLEVELTETIFVTDAEAALAMLRRIRAMGVRVALDDFGTGYSSLSYLRSFPFDKIKIDRSFVRELGTRNGSHVIVQAIHDIARGLDMTITAEGVETAEQEILLRDAGCQELQGFLYSRPRPNAALSGLWDTVFFENEPGPAVAKVTAA